MTLLYIKAEIPPQLCPNDKIRFMGLAYGYWGRDKYIKQQQVFCWWHEYRNGFRFLLPCPLFLPGARIKCDKSAPVDSDWYLDILFDLLGEILLYSAPSWPLKTLTCNRTPDRSKFDRGYLLDVSILLNGLPPLLSTVSAVLICSLFVRYRYLVIRSYPAKYLLNVA